MAESKLTIEVLASRNNRRTKPCLGFSNPGIPPASEVEEAAHPNRSCSLQHQTKIWPCIPGGKWVDLYRPIS